MRHFWYRHELDMTIFGIDMTCVIFGIDIHIYLYEYDTF